MTLSDWLGGTALALLFAPIIGVIGALMASIVDMERGASISSRRDIRRGAFIATGAFVVLAPLCAMLAKADRQDAESWQVYARDHKCIAVDSRTRTTTQFNPATKTVQSSTVTEYLWRCEGGDEHWRP